MLRDILFTWAPVIIGATIAVIYYGDGGFLVGALAGLIAGQALSAGVMLAQAGYHLLRSSKKD